MNQDGLADMLSFGHCIVGKAALGQGQSGPDRSKDLSFLLYMQIDNN